MRGPDDSIGETFQKLAVRIDRSYRGGVSAQDAVQEAWIRAWLQGERPGGEAIRSWEAWVGAAAFRLAHSEWRHRRAEARALARYTDLARTAQAAAPDAGGPAGLHDAVRLLSRRQREVVILHYYRDLDVREIASILGVAEGTVKSSLHRAREALRRHLGSRQGTDGRGPGMSAWHLAGDHPEQYTREFGDGGPGGLRSARLWLSAKKAKGFGTLMQSFRADRYRGRRMRFSALVRTRGVDEWAGLWMRVDAGDHMLAFDNMQDRAPSGTTDWTRYPVVLDVPQGALSIHFGLLLSGGGETAMAGVTFEPVGPDVPVTGRDEDVYEPQDLDFGGT